MRQVALLGILLASLAACSPAEGTRIPPATGDLPRTVVSKNVNPEIIATVPDALIAGARDAGRAPASELIDIALTLRYRNQADLDKLVREQSSPGSPNYRRWLSNRQFADRYAPSAIAYQRVLASLRRAGFTNVQIYSNRTVIDARGTVAVVERYFRTEIRRFVQSGRRETSESIVRAVSAPRELKGLLVNVDGLSTFSVMSTMYERVGVHRPLVMQSRPSGGVLGPVSSVTGFAGYAPYAFTNAYDLPSLHKSTAKTPFDGSGRTAAVVIDADFTNADIAGFLNYFHISRTASLQRLRIHGGPPPADISPDSVEATLDISTIASNAPGAAIRVYEMPQLSLNYITDAYNKVVADNRAEVVNSSFGGCEQDAVGSTLAWSGLFEQGAAKGIMFASATGDTGGGLCANSPATSPYDAAVGGTSLTVGQNAVWAIETGWQGSGGGLSAVFASPTWQNGVSGTVNRGRDVPDIAFDADPYTGTALYYDGSWNTQFNPIGGTSLASPIYAAAVLGIDQVIGSRSGLGSEALFQTWSSTGYGSPSAYFHDITEGDNGPFFAMPGYDLVTGIGSLDAWNVASALRPH